jgi:hypothetical protein
MLAHEFDILWAPIEGQTQSHPSCSRNHNRSNPSVTTRIWLWGWQRGLQCYGREVNPLRRLPKRLSTFGQGYWKREEAQWPEGWLRASKDELRDGTASRGHHPQFNSWCPADWDWLQDRSLSIREEIGWIDYQEEKVYWTPAHNTLASRMIIDQITPIYPKMMKKSIRMSSASRWCWV